MLELRNRLDSGLTLRRTAPVTTPRFIRYFIPRAGLKPILALVAVGLLADHAAAQMLIAASSSPAIELKQLSLEQLLDIQVTSVSKQPEKLLDAAAAIQVITDDDIRRSGATNLPEALRLADNLNVAQENSHDWAISARGFNANLANKLLVLIDGRAVYTPLYGGVLWNAQDVMLEDVDRIEVISGPGGTLWGANAVNGVINITSKSARDTQGLYLEGGGGSSLQDFAGVRYGGTLAPNVFFRVYGNYFDRDGEVFADGSDAGDDWRMRRGGFRLDAEGSPQTTVTLQGDVYSGSEDFGPVGTEGLNGGNVLGRWSHELANASDMTLQVYYDHTHLSEPYAAVPAAPPFVEGFPASALVDNLDTYDMDFQHSLHLERNKVVWGLGYRFTHEMDTNEGIIRFVPPALDQNLFSAFLQDEIALQENWQLTAGTKLEHNDYTGLEVEPSLRLQWMPAPKQMLWSAVSRAVRTPARFDRDLNVVTGLVNAPPPYQFPTDYLDGSQDFVSEKVVAYETGWRAQLGAKTTVSLSLFYNDYTDVRSTEFTPTTATYPVPYPVVFGNNLEGETHGFEFTGNYQVLDWWRLHAGYTLLREHIHAKPGFVDATGATNETADPGQQWSVRSAMDLPHNLEFDAALRWVDSLTINESPTSGPVTGTVPSYYETDARLAWHSNHGLELALVGQNLLHAHHPEYGFPSATREEIQRRVYGKVTWHY
jgi:iron complex outermembrane receptor protein